MAKRPKKVKSDHLAIALKQLEIADRDGARALRFLCRAILEPVHQPAFKICEFKVGKKKYKALLTPDQRRTIVEAVKQGGNVQKTVSELLGNLSGQIGVAANGLISAFHAVVVKGQSGVTLGCCKYDGGKTSNLSQTQCSQYSGSSWDPSDPNCMKDDSIAGSAG